MSEYMPINTVALSLPKLHFTTFCPSIVAECRISSVHHLLYSEIRFHVPLSASARAPCPLGSNQKLLSLHSHDKDMI